MTDTPTAGQYDINAVSGIDKLRERMRDAGDDITAWSHILKDYVKFGNNKVADTVAIFNMNSATDCNNRNTKHCQVPDGMCYAFNDEERYGTPLEYRRRQEYLWDCLDADTWAAAFNELVSRKRNPVTAIRFSEAGDFRSDADIIKVNEIAKKVDVDVFTYSASYKLDWSLASDFTINASNEYFTNADRRFMALPEGADLPDGSVWCPFDLADRRGMETDERPKCGECRLCIDPEGPDVAIPLH